MEETKDFLYGNIDVERLDNTMQLMIKRDAKYAFKYHHGPNQKITDGIMARHRNYKADI